MIAMPDQVQYDTYGPDRFAEHLPFGRNGYLFTVPGTFPDDTPAHTNVTNWEMAVYRTRASGAECWEVRDVNGNRKVWAEAETRREAVGLAFAEISRLRHVQAAEIARRRVNVLDLEAVPPYGVEITNESTLVVTPRVVARLLGIENGGPDTPERYHVTALGGGDPYVIHQGSNVSLHTVTTGLLHARCGCNENHALWFESERMVAVYMREALNAYELCPKSPPDAQAANPPALDAPTVGEQDPTDTESPGVLVTDPMTAALSAQCEDAHCEAKRARCAALTTTAAFAAHLIREHLPTAATLTVDVTNGNLRAVLDAERRTLWYAPASPIGLHEGIVDEVEALMRDVLEFGADEKALEQAGWQNPGAYDDTYDLVLPKVQAQQ